MLLEVDGLTTTFRTKAGEVKAVDGVSFNVRKGETLGIVGESGSGKSVSSLSIMQLIPNPPGKIIAGQVLFDKQDLLKMPPAAMRKIRGQSISMIFQEPMTSLNPVLTVGYQISEVIRLHMGLSKKDALDRAVRMLKLVGIPSPERRVHEYPHMLSGGMRQRVMIAMALSCNPKLLIADEPTTALDVTIQAQILELMRKLRHDIGMSIILITHDLGVVAEMCDRVAVMYAGRILEEALVNHLFEDPLHPYTQGLLRSIPRIGDTRVKLHVIEGTVPNLHSLPLGCRFAPRCSRAFDVCIKELPELKLMPDGRRVACWLFH